MIVNVNNRCNHCWADLNLLSWDYWPFWWCNNYPKCSYSEDVRKSNKEFIDLYWANPREISQSIYINNYSVEPNKVEYNYIKWYVYVLYFKYQDFYKIGYSIDPNSRIISLANEHKKPKEDIKNQFESCFDNIDIVCLLETYNYKTLEKQLHFLFQDKIIYRQEYFNLNENDIISIENVKNICWIKVNLIKDFNLNIEKNEI